MNTKAVTVWAHIHRSVQSVSKTSGNKVISFCVVSEASSESIILQHCDENHRPITAYTGPCWEFELFKRFIHLPRRTCASIAWKVEFLDVPVFKVWNCHISYILHVIFVNTNKYILNTSWERACVIFVLVVLNQALKSMKIGQFLFRTFSMCIILHKRKVATTAKLFFPHSYMWRGKRLIFIDFSAYLLEIAA